MTDHKNSWIDIAERVRERGQDALWDYLTALRAMDTKGPEDRSSIKLMLTSPLRGIYIDVMDIGSTYETLRNFRTEKDVLNFLERFAEDMKYIERHYRIHVMKGWRAIGECEISMEIGSIRHLNGGKMKGCLWLIFLINKFVRKIYVRGELIG